MRNFRYYIAISVLTSIIGIVGFSLLLNSPYLGVDFERRGAEWYVTAVDPNGPAASFKWLQNKKVESIGELKPGQYDLSRTDEGLWSINLYKRRAAARDYLSGYLTQGSVARITAIDASDPGTEARTAEIVVSRLPASRILLRYGAYFLSGLFFIAVSLMVLHKKPDDIRSYAFFAMSLFGQLIYTTYGAYECSETVLASLWKLDKVFSYLDMTASSFAISSLIFFAFVFPRKKMILSNRGVLALFLIVPLAVLYIYSEVSSSAIDLFILFCAAITTVTIVRSYYTSQSPIERAGIKWVVWGVSIPMALFAFQIIEIALTGQSSFGAVVPIFFGLSIPVSIGFSILKYRLMDIDILFDKSVIYAITILILGILDIAIIMGMNRIYPFKDEYSHISGDLISVWFVIIAYVPIRRFVQNIFKKIFNRESYDPTSAAIELGKRLLLAENPGISFSRALDIVNMTLHPKFGVCVASGSYRELYEAGSRLALDFASVDIGSIRKPTRLMDYFPVSTLPAGLTGGVCVPVMGSSGNHGYMILGDKLSERLYSSEDLKFLETISNQLAMFVDALKSREEMERVQKEAAEEHDYISREIHDGIGSNLVKAILLADIIGKNPADASEDIPALKKTLTTGLTELRVLVNSTRESNENTVFDLNAQIKELCSSVDSKNGLKCRTTSMIESYERRLPANVRYNLVRIVQESITNALKHSKADNLEITMSETGGRLSIEVRDNGVGFDHAGKKSVGNGIENIRKRCMKIGAKVEFRTRHMVGTSVWIEADLNDIKEGAGKTTFQD